MAIYMMLATRGEVVHSVIMVMPTWDTQNFGGLSFIRMRVGRSREMSDAEQVREILLQLYSNIAKGLN